MKTRPILFSAPMVRAILEGTKTQTRRAVKDRHIDAAPPACFFQWLRERCPYGQPGDRLWVREAWCPIPPQDPNYNGGRPIAIDYAASHGRESHQWRVMDDLGTRRWKPSIHMPRWASRILLEITAVRVELLQDISDNDIEAEGTAQWVKDGGKVMCPPPGFDGWWPDEDGNFYVKPNRVAFCSLWESVNGLRAWDANPWVWVIDFKRAEGGEA